MANERLDWLRQQREAKFAKPAVKAPEPKAVVATASRTYEYRDPEKRRAYMAELMRKRRKDRAR